MAKKKAIEAGGLRLKRVYDPPAADDGLRILVDRLWPRGIAKEKARVDIWLKDISPSDALRRRVHSDATDWDTFIVDYAAELAAETARAAVAIVRERLSLGTVTLLYAARDTERNNAVALAAWLEGRKA